MSTTNPSPGTARATVPGVGSGTPYAGGVYGNEPHSAARLEAAQIVAGLVFLVGVWCAIAPWVVDYTGTGDQAYWNDLAVGIAIAAVALAKLAKPQMSALSWLNIALGIWLIVAPWVLGYNIGTDSAAQWNDLACGIFVVSLGVIGASLSAAAREHPATPQAGVRPRT